MAGISAELARFIPGADRHPNLGSGNRAGALLILLCMANHDPDAGKGAVEQDRPEQPTNTSLSGQLPHRTDNRLVKSSDSDFPEPGSNPEHSGEAEVEMCNQNLPQDKERHNPRVPNQENPEAQLNDQDPGQRQKENQNQRPDDPLAA